MFKKMPLKNKPLFYFFIIYTLSHIFFYTNNLYFNFLNSLFWLTFLIIYYHQDFKFSKKDTNITLIVSITFFILYFSNGFIFGFNKSLYNYSLINIVTNLIKIILPMWGIEIIRFKLLKSNPNYVFFRALITIIIILSEINFKALFLFPNLTFFHDLISIIIPLIAQNILFTYLSLNSNYNVPLIIRLFNEIPPYLLPITPYYNWFMEGSFAIIKVLIIYYLFKYFIFKQKTRNYSLKRAKIIYFLTITFSIILVLFKLGIFNYHAIAILSNSMNPTFERGDIVIYKKNKNIIPGDIIVFQNDNQIIVHRVVSINAYYVTKGDANNTVDYLKIKNEDIKGVYKFHLKYLGYPAIWLNEFLTKEN